MITSQRSFFIICEQNQAITRCRAASFKADQKTKLAAIESTRKDLYYREGGLRAASASWKGSEEGRALINNFLDS